jgi:hypothetical protein
MLDLNHERQLVTELWDASENKVTIPPAIEKQFFQSHGPTPTYYDNRRSYHRYFMRGKAVLTRGDKNIGTYTKDVSRQGVGFLSPVQLMPQERVRLRIPSAELSLQVARCRRVTDGCYDCGAKFALENSTPEPKE